MAYGDISDDPTVLHEPHAECAVECPHAMSVCGRFQKVGSGNQVTKAEARKRA